MWAKFYILHNFEKRHKKASPTREEAAVLPSLQTGKDLMQRHTADDIQPEDHQPVQPVGRAKGEDFPPQLGVEEHTDI